MGGASVDETHFERAEIAVKIAPESGEIENEITNELSWAVVSGLSASIDLDDRVRKVGFASEAGLVPGAADGVNRFVFEEEDGVGNLAEEALTGEFCLEFEGVFIGDAAQPLKFRFYRHGGQFGAITLA